MAFLLPVTPGRGLYFKHYLNVGTEVLRLHIIARSFVVGTFICTGGTAKDTKILQNQSKSIWPRCLLPRENRVIPATLQLLYKAKSDSMVLGASSGTGDGTEKGLSKKSCILVI